LVDAGHEAVTLDRLGNVSALGRTLGRLQRGSSISLPEVRLAELSDIGAGLRSRMHKRLLAFGRDVVGRLLEPLRDLETADHATLRAVAYQLRERLGTALRGDLDPLLDDLDDDARDKLAGSGVRVGHVAVFLPELLRPAPLEQRATLLTVAEPGARPPLALGRPSYAASALSPKAWLTLGYIVLGARAARADLVERAADALAGGAAEPHALRWLSVPKAEVVRAGRALRERLAR
jgi:ATP-dependent RNA helicase SUPV3L1/SUV3